MKYGHVGRPTNEEVVSRKRKKALAVIVPLALVIVAVVVLSQNGLNGLMGNSVCEYTCENGWTNDGTLCYQEKTATSTVSAYLIGDVVNELGETDPDGQVTLQDFSYIKNAIDNNVDLTEEQKIIYDLNGDGNVDSSDVASYSTSTTGQFIFTKKYACPKDSEKTQTGTSTLNSESVSVITKTKYKLEGDSCTEIVATRIEKNAVCKKENTVAQEKKTEEQPEQTEPEETEEVQPEEVQPATPTSANSCTYDASKNLYTCDAIKTPMVNETGIADDNDEIDEDESNEVDNETEYDDESESVEDDYEEASDDEEFEDVDEEGNDEEEAFLNKTSNYLKYADTNASEWKLGFLTVDSQTGLVAPIEGSMTINKGSDCKDAAKLTTAAIYHSGISVLESFIYKDKNITEASTQNTDKKNVLEGLNFFKYIKENVESKGSVDLYLDMAVSNPNYTVEQNCQKITIKKGQTTIPNATFKIKSKKYVDKIKIDFGTMSKYVSNNGVIEYELNKKKYTKFPVYSSFKISVGKPKSGTAKLLSGIKNKKNNKVYKLAGFSLMKNSKYLCYKNAKHDNNEFTWEGKCKNGKIMFLSNKKSELSKYLVDGGSYVLQAIWKTNNIVVKLKNSKTNKAYQRWAQVQLYKTKNGCDKTIASDKFGKVYKQPELRKANKGVIKISNNLELGKTYYLRIDPSKYMNKKSSPQCLAVKTSTKTVNVKLVPKHFEVKYAKGSKKATGKMADHKGGKYTDKVITLKKNKFKRSGYKFSHWVASRKVTVKGKKVTQYKCVKSGKVYQWASKKTCKKKGYKKYKNGAKMNINTFEGNITMHARWTKAKKSTKKKTTKKKTTKKKTTKKKTTKKSNSSSSSKKTTKKKTTKKKTTKKKTTTKKTTKKKTTTKKTTSKKTSKNSGPKTMTVSWRCPSGYSNKAGDYKGAQCSKKVGTTTICTKGKLVNKSTQCKWTETTTGKCSRKTVTDNRTVKRTSIVYSCSLGGVYGSNSACKSNCKKSVSKTGTKYLKYRANYKYKSVVPYCSNSGYSLNKSGTLCTKK